MKLVNTQEYVSMLRELTEQGREVNMLISGNSMSPFLMHGRDSIRLKKPDRKLRKGDMVFFQRKSGKFVMHRIIRVRKEGFYLLGDSQQSSEIEGPIEESQIFPSIPRFCVTVGWFGQGNYWGYFFEHYWIRMISFRRFLINTYRFMSSIRR